MVQGMLQRQDGAATVVPVVPVPTGTSNNFARDLGLVSRTAAFEAIAHRATHTCTRDRIVRHAVSNPASEEMSGCHVVFCLRAGRWLRLLRCSCSHNVYGWETVTRL